MLTKKILYFDQSLNCSCDGNCKKAWGYSARPFIQLSNDEDDFEWKSDSELGTAPKDPGTYEGRDGKPASSKDFPNKWCVRQCERSVMTEIGQEIILPDFSKRIRNIEQ